MVVAEDEIQEGQREVNSEMELEEDALFEDIWMVHSDSEQVSDSQG